MKTENHEDFLAQDFKDNIELLPSPSRREFIQLLGGGIVIVVLGDFGIAQDASRERGARGSLPSDFNAFLRIGEDGRVTCFTGKIEMGQGTMTSLPQMLAEELEVPLDSVDMVMGDTALCPWDGGTFGSLSTRSFGPALRAAAAEANGVLLELAAESLKVPQAQLLAKDGMIIDRQNKERRVGYGQLTKGQEIERHLRAKPVLKDPSEFTVMGKGQVHRDAREKVTGKAQFAGDIRVPGMLYAKVLKPPAHGAKLKTVDTEPCRQVAGIRVVREGDLVAVLHELPDMAEAALTKIKADFEPSPSGLSDKNIFDHMLKVSSASRVVAEGGNLEDGRKLAQKKFETTYLNSYVAHAPIETHTALAKIEGDKATVWASTQTPFALQEQIARTIGLDAKNVRVIVPFVGGGFGGKTRHLQALDAAHLAKAVGKPVQVMANREEEFYYDTFRPAAVVRINSGIDASGKIVFWDYDVACAGERGSQQFYIIPHHRTVSRDATPGGPAAHPFATGPWRAPANNTNTFARESQIEMMAAAAGIDPVEFRLQHLSDTHLIAVLKAAAERFGWKPAKGPSKRGYGVALGIDAGTYVAAIAEVALDVQRGAVQVKRVVSIQDMGVVVNPEGAARQMEGGITMGMGYALTEEVHFKNGAVLERNFDTYEIPRFSSVPKIETGFIESEAASQGGGEPAIIVMGAVIANAIFDATGARVLHLPMTRERIKEALRTVQVA